GSNSQSAIYDAAQRLKLTMIDKRRIPLVLHLTDHDPTGIDMTRDTIARLEKYALYPVEVKRIALTMDQVQQYSLPPNYVEETDTRTSGYRQQFGTDECWELDALPPDVIVGLIRDELEFVIDSDKWERAQRKEKRGEDLLTKTAQN